VHVDEGRADRLSAGRVEGARQQCVAQPAGQRDELFLELRPGE
jgi:hypothetical protein